MKRPPGRSFGWRKVCSASQNTRVCLRSTTQTREPREIQQPPSSPHLSSNNLQPRRVIAILLQRHNFQREIGFACEEAKSTDSLVTTAHAPMSTTMTLTMSQAPGVHACPNCGTGLPDHTDLAIDAQKRIEDLEAQVRLLTAKATAAGLSPPSFHPGQVGVTD